MNISIITTNLRICGLVRELIEMSNSLKKLGNEVTIYIYENKKIDWINVNSTIIILNENIKIKSDVLILMDAPYNYLMPYFYNACSKFKTYIITGLDKKYCLYNVIKTNSNSSATDIEQNKLFKNYEICADGKWQLDFLNKHNIKVGEKIGGININMFYNMNIKRTNEILISGDTRWSKGYDMLMDLLKNENYTTCRNTINQSNLCKKYNESLIYIDNHTWAGWCNPVLEAMACGCAVICTNIGATSEFAINNETALVVEPDNIEQFKNALKKLRTNPSLVKKLSISAQEKAKEFKYNIVINKFNNYLETKLLNHYRNFWNNCDSHMAHIDYEYIKDNPIGWVNMFLHKIDFKDKVIIDYGVGNGLLGTILFKFYNINKYIGIDIAQRQLDITRNNLKGNNIELYLSPIDFKSLNADIFISQAVIQHFPNLKYLTDFLLNLNNSNCKYIVLQIRHGKTSFNNILSTREDWRLACHTNKDFINKYLINYKTIFESNISKCSSQYLIYKK